MLALTRQEGESFIIFPRDLDSDMTVAELFSEGPIKILINEASSQVRLAIEAPDTLSVLREELRRSEQQKGTDVRN